MWVVDLSPVTCLFPVSSSVLSTRLLTFLAYVFLLLSRRLVYTYHYWLHLPVVVRRLDLFPFYEHL